MSKVGGFIAGYVAVTVFEHSIEFRNRANLDFTRQNVRKAIMKVATLIAAAVLASTGIEARAGQMEDARAAYAKGDFATAFRLGHQAAEKGDGSAQAMLGYMYHDGEGVARNYMLAFMWFQLAAAQLEKEARLKKDNKLFDLSRDTAQAMDLTASLMTPAEITEAHRKAYQCQANGFKSCDR